MGKLDQIFRLMTEAESKRWQELGRKPTIRTLYIGQVDFVEMKQDVSWPQYFSDINLERTGRGDFEIGGFDAIIVKRDRHLHAVVE